MKRLSVVLFACVAQAGVALATNYNANWNNAERIFIDDTEYYDFLTPAVWVKEKSTEYKDPTTMSGSDNYIMGSANPNVSFSADATLRGWIVEGGANTKKKFHLNGKSVSVSNWRVFTKGVSVEVTGQGTLTIPGFLKWPDRGWTSEVNSNNTFTISGADTVVKIGTSSTDGGLNFGDRQDTSKAGAAAGNRVIVKDGARLEAYVNLAKFANTNGLPNGLYITGEGTVFSNRDNDAMLRIRSSTGGGSFSNEFVLADGAVAQNMRSFYIGETNTLNYGVGHLLAFRGAETSHEFTKWSVLGKSQRMEVDGATVGHENLQNWGSLTVKNGGRLDAKLYGFYNSQTLIVGEGSVFSNRNDAGTGEYFFHPRVDISNTVFTVADGGRLENIGRFRLRGKNNRLVFSGAKTDQTLFHDGGFSTVEAANELSVEAGAKLRIRKSDGTKHNNNRIRLYGDIIVTGAGSLLFFDTAGIMVAGGPNVAGGSNITVADGARFDLGGGVALAADGGTNACLYVRNGGVVTATGGISVGQAATNETFTVAPHHCVLEIAGEGSVLSNNVITVGTCASVNANALGCCTNGHHNVLRIRDGGRLVTSGDVNIGFMCASNSLEVTGGGKAELKGHLYLGRAEGAQVGTHTARACAFDNFGVVADGGEVGARGFVSLRGVRSSLFVTNGVVRAGLTNYLECADNSGYLQIAGTNSMVKGDLRLWLKGGTVDFALPVAGYCRAALQSDRELVVNEAVNFSFIAPDEAGQPASAYPLFSVPESGTLTISQNLRTKLNTALAALKARDPRFACYRLKDVTEAGSRCLQLVPGAGMTIIIR